MYIYNKITLNIKKNFTSILVLFIVLTLIFSLSFGGTEINIWLYIHTFIYIILFVYFCTFVCAYLQWFLAVPQQFLGSTEEYTQLSCFRALLELIHANDAWETGNISIIVPIQASSWHLVSYNTAHLFSKPPLYLINLPACFWACFRNCHAFWLLLIISQIWWNSLALRCVCFRYTYVRVCAYTSTRSESGCRCEHYRGTSIRWCSASVRFSGWIDFICI